VLRDFGLLQIFEGRSVTIRPEYDERCERATEGIDVLGFGLSAFIQDHRQDFTRWKTRLNIRILAIDPDFPSQEYSFAAQRDVEENASKGEIARDVQSLASTLMPLLSKEGEAKTFEVRLYRCLPSINIFRIDDDVLWGPYFMREPSRNSITFLARRGGHLYARVVSHFNEIWNDPALSVPLSDWMNRAER
jgi:hypothetical protein